MPTKGLTSPEGLLMLCVAATLDLAGFMIFIFGTWFGIDDYGILEMVGIAIIGLWMAWRYSSLGKIPEVAEEYRTGKKAWEESDMDAAEKYDALLAGQKEKINMEEKGASPKKEDVKMEAPNKSAPDKKSTPSKWKNPQEMAKDQAKQLVKKALKRFGLNFIIELLPFLGGFWPGWTIIVWKEMKE